ncbi:MAG: peptidase domain-containing ABC transporter [Bacteroidales bacterium]
MALKNQIKSRRLNKYFLTQHDRTDCGVVCLYNIIKFYEGEIRLEQLRTISGTNMQGTTLLGLKQAAVLSGFNAEGLRADMEYLKKIDSPVILHVTLEDNYKHYIIIYEYHKGHFKIGDPSTGITEMDEKELAEIWNSRSLLELSPIDGVFLKSRVHKNKMKSWFLDLIREDLTILTTIFITGIVVSLLGIAIAIYSQTLIDNLIPSGDLTRIVLATFFIFLILIFRSFTGYFRQSFIINQGRDINIRMIDKFFSRLLRQPLAFFNTRRTGDMVARLNDTNKIQQTITYITGELLINALLLIISLAAVYFYYPLAGLILTAGMPIYFLIAWAYHKSILDKQKNLMAAHAVNESNYISTIENVAVIKSSIKEQVFANHGKTIYGFFQQQIYNLGKTGINLNLLTEITGIILIMGITAASISAMLYNNMLPGEFVALLTLTNNIIPAGAALAFANIQLQSARVAFERTYEISSGECEYDIRQDSQAKNIKTFSTLRVKNISFRYPGRKLILDNFSLELNKGEIKTIFGENGCGKSTLFNIIQKFYTPESGSIELNGKDLSGYSIQSFRKIIGVVPQQISLFNATIYENIILGASPESAKTSIKELETHDLLSFFEQFPEGLATMIEERGLNISGGQKKLIGLARALCHKPKLLLADELTSSSDRKMENFFIELFQKIKQEIPVIQITHNLKAAKTSDEILILENGRVTSSGTHESLMQSENIYSLSFGDYYVNTK